MRMDVGTCIQSNRIRFKEPEPFLAIDSKRVFKVLP